MNEIPDDTIDWIKTISSDDQRPEIQRGIRAIRHVLNTQGYVPNAMYRDGLGTIGFRYGWHKPASRTHKRSGQGIAHIIGSTREDYGKYEGSPKTEEVLRMIPEVIFDGTISRSHRDRILITHKGYIVLLTSGGKRPDAKKWLFHSYKLRQKK